MTETRLIAKDSVPPEQFTDVATRAGWKLNHRATRVGQKQESPRFVWNGEDGTISLVKDVVLDVDYFAIDTPDPVTAKATLSNSFRCYDTIEIIEMARNASSSVERAHAFTLLGAAKYIEYNKDLFGLLTERIRQSDPVDRAAAVFAAGRLSWRQLRPVVAEAVESADTESSFYSYSDNILNLSPWDR
jgi:hypothetical protein